MILSKFWEVGRSFVFLSTNSEVQLGLKTILIDQIKKLTRFFWASIWIAWMELLKKA